jgi:hemerythrin
MPEPFRLFEWSAAWAVGDRMIDSEHQHLFGRAETLHQSMLRGQGKTALSPLLDDLAEYTLLHFAHEEDLMTRSAYPDLYAHQVQHEVLRKRVADLRRRVDGGAELITIEFMLFLADWLQHHIGTSDRAIGAYLANLSGESRMGLDLVCSPVLIGEPKP